MKISYAKKLEKKTAVCLIPLFENDALKHISFAEGSDELKRHVADLKDSKIFEAKDAQTVLVYKLHKNLPEKIILVGLGDRKKISTARVLTAIGAGVKATMPHTAAGLSVVFNDGLKPQLAAFVEALVMGSYQPSLPYKTGEAKEKLLKNRVNEIELVCDFSPEQKATVSRAVTIAQATNDVRDWVNAPPNYAHTDFFEARAKEIAKMPRVSLKILDKSKLEKLNMGAFLGVNRGSKVEAKMLVLEYSPKNAPSNEAPMMLVGKGILFDSGGYNLKPSGHIEDMHLDKSGAAVVLATMRVLAQLEYPRKVIAITPMTDNLIGPTALRPSEILTTYSGKTIEVLNTDGEGRLILSDAVAYGIDVYKPKLLIDVATLTGACMIALGERHAGLFSNDEDLMEELYVAGQQTDEILWKMPIHQDDADKMKGTFADLRNSDTGTSRLAGASKGAAFIREFVGDTPWAHLDIAGPAFVADPKKYETKGATGFGVRVLTQFLENQL